ncbi:polysaccharide pyruvyl transferase family protein [Patescibacteria group bacterium]
MKHRKRKISGKKVGIITYHDGINYGAYFQAHSLFRLLEEVFKLDVEFINYKSLRHRLLENLVFYHRFYDLQYLRNNINKIYKFKKAQSKFKVSRKVISKTWFRKIKYDYVFYGSDEIWNFKNPLVGFNPIYFGSFVDSEKVSYAPSFGSLSDSIKLSEKIVSELSTFKSISVRDKNSQQIILKNLRKKVPIVLDPTLLIGDELTPVLPKSKGYVLVYTTKIDDKILESIKMFAYKHNKQLISVGYYYSWCDRSYVDVGPSEWLGFYENADYVITSMFHGTIYAIKSKKNFVSIITEYRRNKLSSFLEEIGLKSRILTKPKDLDKILSRKPSYDKAFKEISARKKKSLEYIKQSLAK